MKIKRVSILGFKSIMDRLDISFPLGISGVVGPNGCGKSNIVDAIRWCLGEQSPKELRGRRMEDVIFNGAGELKPFGMAEVTITFENGDGTFPPAHASDSELSVTRRLYRSGESEYRINNVPCRLKDIQEIFMDTGLGNRAYSVIGQGRISTIIEQKPEETRIMLEEAAGITKYRRKVVASEKKIELTQVNLQRVEDILGEVERQMRSLRRQAARARRFKAIGEEIRALELRLYCNSFHRLQAESGSRQRSTDDLVGQEVSASAALGQIYARIGELNLEQDSKEEVLSELRRRHLALRERFHKQEASIESLSAEIRMQEQLELRLAAEKEEIGRRLNELAGEKTRLQEEAAKQRERDTRMQSEVAAREKRLRARREMLQEIRQSFEQARAVMNDGLNREMGLSHESSYLNKMIQQLTDSRTRQETELQECRARKDQVLKASERKSQGREMAAEKLAELEAAVEQHKLESEELSRILKRAESDLKAKESELNACQSRLSSLQSLTENYEGYQVGVRTIMKATDLPLMQEGRILGLVADVLQVEPGYEQAVEAALADRLQHVIVRTQQDGRTAVDYLKEKARGKSGFVPLADLRGRPAFAEHPAEEPRPRPLQDFVEVAGEYRPLIEALLGDVYLVPDLGAGITAWQQNGTDRSFVTQEGDMVDQRGVVSGGKLTHGSRGLLARKREIQELARQVDLFGRQVAELKAQLESLQHDLDRKQEGLENLIEHRWSGQEEINEFDKALFRLGQELDQLERLENRIASEMKAKGHEEGKQKETLARIQDELRRSRESRKQEDALFRHKELELRETEAEFERMREDLAQVQSDQRLLQEEQRSLAREIERLEEYAEGSRNRSRKIEEEIALGLCKREECLARSETLQEELKERYDSLKVAEDDVQRVDQERAAGLSRVKEAEAQAEKQRADLAALKDRVNRMRMEHSEVQFRLNHLSQTVQEKYGLVLADIYAQHVEADFSQAAVEAEIERRKTLRQRLGEVNLTAIKEHEALKERYEFISKQRTDLIQSIESLKSAIRKINRTSLERFQLTFTAVDQKLREIFPILFNGGKAGLRLTDESQPLESGVLVEVQPQGKKLSHMGLLSGGEKALVAMALLFAIYMIKPSPFCLLDEVDAPLDEANIDRFNELLQEIRKSTQVIMVTHNKRTMEITDRLYGITMERAGISKLVSVNLERLKEQIGSNPSLLQPSFN